MLGLVLMEKDHYIILDQYNKVIYKSDTKFKSENEILKDALSQFNSLSIDEALFSSKHKESVEAFFKKTNNDIQIIEIKKDMAKLKSCNYIYNDSKLSKETSDNLKLIVPDINMYKDDFTAYKAKEQIESSLD